MGFGQGVVVFGIVLLFSCGHAQSVLGIKTQSYALAQQSTAPQDIPATQLPAPSQLSLDQPVTQKPLQSPVAVKLQPTIRSVRAECREDSVFVVVQRDLLGIGNLVQPSEVSLGGCAATGQDDAATVLFFQAPLQACGSTLTVINEALVYTFTLLYVPHTLGGTPIVRTNGAAVVIECHYLRFHNVSSKALKPIWIPFFAARSAEGRLTFILRLALPKNVYRREPPLFFLGDVMTVEALVVTEKHTPLRVFVDSCVATLEPDVNAVPRYAFIENHGCLTDAKQTGSCSHFLPRTRDDQLQFELDVFRFSGDTRSLMYITCLLKAIPVSAPSNAQYKACSFTSGRWVANGGDDQVCSCCDSTCAPERGGSLDRDLGRLVKATVGPIRIHDAAEVAQAG